MGPPTLRYQGLDGATHSPVPRKCGWPLSSKEMWMAPFVLGDVSHGRSTRAARGQRRLPGRTPGPEGTQADRTEAADTPRGGGNRDVVTIRKIGSCPPRGYVDGPQTWASVESAVVTTSSAGKSRLWPTAFSLPEGVLPASAEGGVVVDGWVSLEPDQGKCSLSKGRSVFQTA